MRISFGLRGDPFNDGELLVPKLTLKDAKGGIEYVSRCTVMQATQAMANNEMVSIDWPAISAADRTVCKLKAQTGRVQERLGRSTIWCFDKIRPHSRVKTRGLPKNRGANPSMHSPGL